MKKWQQTMELEASRQMSYRNVLVNLFSKENLTIAIVLDGDKAGANLCLLTCVK